MPIFSDLQSHARRYEKLKSVFAEFHANVLTLPQFGGPPPEMEKLVVGELVGGTHFDLTMAGTTVRVGFSYLPGQHGIHGVMTGHVIDPSTSLPLNVFTTLTFTGHSETTMHHKNGNAMMLNDKVSAHWVAATLMSDGLHRRGGAQLPPAYAKLAK